VRVVLPPYATQPGTGFALPPHPKQKEFHALTTKYKYMRGGLGSGKSWAGAQELIAGILRNYAAFCKLPMTAKNASLEYHVACPSYQLIEAGPWECLTTILEQIEMQSGFSIERRRWLSHPRKIELIGGMGTIKFITLPGRFAGSQSAGFWLDEAELADDPMSCFIQLNNRLRDRRANRPFGIVTSSPKGDRGLSAYFNKKIAEDPEGSYGQVIAATSDNPFHIGSDYIESMRATFSEREAKENLSGEIVAADNSIFSYEYDSAESLNWRWKAGRKSDKEYNIAIDPGGNSWHALLIEYDRQTDTDTVFDEIIMDGCLPDVFFREIQAVCKNKYGIDWEQIAGVYIDYNPKDVRILSYRYWKGRVHHKRVKDHFAKLAGINCVRWRLKDANGNRRLLFAPQLRATKNPRRVLQSMVNYHWSERRVDSYMIQTTNTDGHSPFSHAADCLRYYCVLKHGHKRIYEMERSAA